MATSTSNLTQDHTNPDSDNERNSVNELFSSIRNGNLKTVRKLLTEGVKTDVVDRNNKDNTPLHYAIEKCQKEIVEELLLPKWNTDVNAKNSNGNTPLHVAACKCDKDIVQLILRNEAAIGAKNHENKTALDLTNDTEIQNILKEAYVSSLNAELTTCTIFRQSSYRYSNRDSYLTTHQTSLDGEVLVQMEQSKKVPQTFPTRPGTSSISGHLYEIHLCMLILLQALKRHRDGKIKTFRLASNVDGLMDFDDIFFEYSYEDQNQHDQGPIQKSKTIFLQAKHIDKVEKKKITTDVIFSRSNTKCFERKFNLNKYFNSYRAIKQQFSKNEHHPIFESQSEDTDHEFIIYSNALSDFSKNCNVKFNKFEVDEEHILYFGSAIHDNNYYELNFSENEAEKVMNILQLSSYRDEEDETGPVSGASTKRNKRKANKKCSFKMNITPSEISSQQFKVQTISTEKVDTKKSNDSLAQHEESLISVGNAPSQKSQILEFFSKFKIFVDKPNEEQISHIIKQKIQLFYGVEEQDASAVFSEVRTKVEKWWKSKKDTKTFLTEDNRYFQDSIRISILFNVKKPVDFFTGRYQDLINLHNLIQRNYENTTSASKITVISGMGGIGKTELARQYIYKHRHDYDDNIIWINAENELSLTESFILLARDKLRINTRNSNEEEKDIKIILEEVYGFFRKRKCLFVFDNADKTEHLREFLPQCPTSPSQHEPYILITSQNQEWEGGVEVIALEELVTKDAVDFVKKKLNIQGDDTYQDQDIKALVTKLQCFPLALQQAIAYITDQNVTNEFSVSDYLTEYTVRKTEILNSAIFANRIDNDYAKTTFTTWKITVDKIRKEKCGQLALIILNIIAYFRRENIERDIFLCLANNDQTKLRSAIRLLVKYSMMREEQGKNILSIHTLVQEVIRLQLKESGKEEDILITALKLMSTRIDSDTVNHAISVFNHASTYKELMRKYAVISSGIIFELIRTVRYKEAFSFATQVLKVLHELNSRWNDISISELFTKNSIAVILYEQGKYDESIKIWKNLYIIQKDTVDENQVDALDTRRSIAKALFAQGKPEEALKSYEEILGAGIEVLKENHKKMLLIKHDIAKIWLYQHKYDQALKSLKEVLAAEEDILGKNDIHTLNTKEAIGDAFVGKEDHREALKVYRELHKRKKSISGDESYEVLNITKKIAGVYTKQGKYKESLALYKEILNTEDTLFAEDHLNILSTKYLITEVLRKTGDNAKALETSEEVFRERKEILGVDHPSTLDAEHSIADILNEIGEYGKALEHYKNVLKHRTTILGSDNIDVLTTRNCLSELLLKQGKYQEALQILEEVYSKRKCLLGGLHKDTLSVKNNMAMALLRNGRCDESLEHYREMLNNYKTIYGEKHPSVFTTNNNIALVLSEKGEEEKALEIFQKVFEEQGKTLGYAHPDTRNTQANIGTLYLKLKKPDDALKFFNKTIIFNENTKDTISMNKMGCIAAAWAGKGYYKLSLYHYKKLLEKRIKASGETNPETLVIRCNIGSVLLNQGKHKEALKIFHNVLMHQKKILSPQHHNFATTNTFLDETLNELGWTRLHLAAYAGVEREIIPCLNEGHDINSTTKDGFKLLHLATENNNEETVRALISYLREKYPEQLHSFINDEVIKTGKTALHISAKNNNEEIVKILLKNGANYDSEDKRRRSPLGMTKFGSNVQNILWCIDSLFRAVKKGKKDKVNALLESQENFNTLQVILCARNKNQQTLINVADNKDRTDIVEMLANKMKDFPEDDPTPINFPGNKDWRKDIAAILEKNMKDCFLDHRKETRDNNNAINIKTKQGFSSFITNT